MSDSDDEMRDEYDFSGGVRGSVVERRRQGRKLVVLEPDVAAVFPSSEAVNEALRKLIEKSDEGIGEQVER